MEILSNIAFSMTVFIFMFSLSRGLYLDFLGKKEKATVHYIRAILMVIILIYDKC
jgi:hypothetical protein